MTSGCPIAEPAPERQRPKFAHCQCVDVANSTSVEMARISMMGGMAVAPVVVGRQRQHAKDSAYPIVRQTMAKEGSMSAIVLDHEEAHKKPRSRYRQQQRQPPRAEINRYPSQRPKRGERYECYRNLEDATAVTRLTIPRESPYRVPRKIGRGRKSEFAHLYHQVHDRCVGSVLISRRCNDKERAGLTAPCSRPMVSPV